MKISKETYKKLKNKGRGAVKSAAAGGKSTIYEGGSGAAVAYLEPQIDKLSFAKDKPWLKSALVIGAGHYLKRKKSLGSVGAALCGAGGVLLGQYMRDRKAKAAATAPAQAPTVAATTAAPPAAAETQGWDTGRVVRFPDTGFVARSAARGL